MEDRFSGTSGRILASSLLAAAVLVPVLLITSPLIARWSELRTEISSSSQTLERYREIGSRRHQLEAELTSLEAAASQQPSILASSAPGQTAAKLQADLKQIVDTYHAQLRSAQTLPDATDGGVSKVSVRFDINCDVVRLENILHQVESSGLFVQRLDIRAPENQASQRPANATPLDVSLEVYRLIAGRQP